MKNKIKLNKRLFPILVLTPEEKEALLKKNRDIDDALDRGLDTPASLKENSIRRLTILHGPKICNFTCPNYCCAEGIAKSNLNKEQVKEVIDQVANWGANVTYWPGLGELTLSRDFWDIQEHVTKKGMRSVVFTNGSVFWDNGLAKKYTGMDSYELIKKVKELEISLYVKYWNSNPENAAKMSGVKSEDYPFITFRGKNIPLALYNLMQTLPEEQLGVETMVSSENYADVIRNIIPTINELGLYGYLEPVIFSGKAQGKQKDLELGPEQYQSLADLFVSGGTYCEKRQSVELIVVGGGMSPGIVIPPREEDNVIDSNGKTRDIFDIFHNSYFRTVRKLSEELDGCLCRAVWGGSVQLHNEN